MTLTKDTVRKAVQDYLGKDHDFCGEILHDDYSEKLRFMDYASDAVAKIDAEDMETEDENGDNMWVHAIGEVERQFLIWLIKGRFSKDEIKQLFL